MDEIAEAMLNGELCECCGVYLDGSAPGFPRYCSEQCAEDRGAGWKNFLEEDFEDDDFLEEKEIEDD